MSMDVPITSDLTNYVLFWGRWLTRLGAVAMVVVALLIAIFVVLCLMYRRLP